MNYFVGALVIIILFAAFIEVTHRWPHNNPARCEHTQSHQCW
jgi:hypothetical protein